MNENKFFLTQIQRSNDGNYTKGVVIKDTLNAARQSFHAYLGAYGYGQASNIDYVACYIMDSAGRITDSIVDDRRPVPPEPDEE